MKGQEADRGCGAWQWVLPQETAKETKNVHCSATK